MDTHKAVIKKLFFQIPLNSYKAYEVFAIIS